MGQNGKYRFDSGRARCTRLKDQARFDFDNDTIDEFLTGDDAATRYERQILPVRYGATHLADHLSDSTIAAAILRSGDLDDPTDAALTGDLFEGTLFDGVVGPLDSKPVDDSIVTPIKPITTIKDRNKLQPAAEVFSWSGVLQGFVMGATVCSGALLVLRWLM